MTLARLVRTTPHSPWSVYELLQHPLGLIQPPDLHVDDSQHDSTTLMVRIDLVKPLRRANHFLMETVGSAPRMSDASWSGVFQALIIPHQHRINPLLPGEE